MRAGQRLYLIFAIVVLAACAVLPTGPAAAQTQPWPTPEAPRAAGPAPWPGGSAPSMSPMSPMSPMGAPPMSPQGSPFGGGGEPPCMSEFAKLRDDVQKKGLAAKAAGDRKATREEMCKHITAYSSAELKWVKFSESNVSTCGIPVQVVQQLKQVHGHTEQTKEKICAAGPGGGPAAAPSLSDALGTTRLPTPETTKSGNGTLDTLTGNAIQR